MSDPLPVVHRLRRLAADEARRALAEYLTVESEAAAALRALDAEIAAETDAASDPDQDDRPVEDFAVWLRRISVDRAAAVAALEDAETQSAEARAVLAASRTAERALEILMEQQAAERRTASEHRDQLALDEIATVRHGSN